jgi:hypothetical protein
LKLCPATRVAHRTGRANWAMKVMRELGHRMHTKCLLPLGEFLPAMIFVLAGIAQAGLLIYGDDKNFVRLDLFNDTRQVEFIKAESAQASGYPTWAGNRTGYTGTFHYVHVCAVACSKEQR